jgi:hypothetical protein
VFDALEAGQAEERWEALSRQAHPDVTIIAFRAIAISLICASIIALVGFRKN